MTDFDYDTWAEATKRIPKAFIGNALNAVVARKKAIDMEPELFAQRNEAATIYHSVQGHTDEAPEWVDPIADFAAYPAGYKVTHEGEIWVNVSQDIACGEPGVDPSWQEASLGASEEEVTENE